MTRQHTSRYCADPDALNALRRDDMGWGHDVDCGCFRDAAGPSGPGTLSRIIAAFKRRF